MGRVAKAQHPGLSLPYRRLAKIIVTIATGVAALWWSHWDWGTAIFIGMFVASLSGLLDGRISITVGLACLVCCPLLLLADQQAWLQQSNLVNYYVASAGIYSLRGAADTVATWAYYFLCIGVAALIVRHIGRDRRRDGA